MKLPACVHPTGSTSVSRRSEANDQDFYQNHMSAKMLYKKKQMDPWRYSDEVGTALDRKQTHNSRHDRGTMNIFGNPEPQSSVHRLLQDSSVRSQQVVLGTGVQTNAVKGDHN
jgi:hypothetical protein